MAGHFQAWPTTLRSEIFEIGSQQNAIDIRMGEANEIQIAIDEFNEEEQLLDNSLFFLSASNIRDGDSVKGEILAMSEMLGIDAERAVNKIIENHSKWADATNAVLLQEFPPTNPSVRVDFHIWARKFRRTVISLGLKKARLLKRVAREKRLSKERLELREKKEERETDLTKLQRDIQAMIDKQQRTIEEILSRIKDFMGNGDGIICEDGQDFEAVKILEHVLKAKIKQALVTMSWES